MPASRFFAVTIVVSRPHASTGSVALLTPLFVVRLQVALLAIYLVSTSDRTLIGTLTITGFAIRRASTSFHSLRRYSPCGARDWNSHGRRTSFSAQWL
jgi:hypothetical protein